MSTSLYFSNKVAPKNLTWIYIMYVASVRSSAVYPRTLKSQNIQYTDVAKSFTYSPRLKAYKLNFSCHQIFLGLT